MGMENEDMPTKQEKRLRRAVPGATITWCSIFRLRSSPAFLLLIPVKNRSGLRLLLLVAVISFLSLSGCSKQEATQPALTNAVAMVNNQAITCEVFQKELRRRAQASPGKYADPKEKQALLEEMIRFEVLHQKALAAGYDKDPGIAASLKRMMVTRYQEDQLARLRLPEVTEEDITSFYRVNPEHFSTPEKVRMALIEINVSRTATPEKRAELAKKAAAIHAEAKSTETADGTFGLLAQRHSEDQASRYRGGDIGWLTASDTNPPWDPAVLAAVFKLTRPGDLAPVIETATAFYLVKLVERRPASTQPLEEVKAGIEYRIARQKAQRQLDDFHTALRQGLKIRVNEALLDSIEVPAQNSQPPGMPGGLTARASNRAAK